MFLIRPLLNAHKHVKKAVKMPQTANNRPSRTCMKQELPSHRQVVAKNERERTRTNENEREQTRTNENEREQTRTNKNKRERTRTNENK